MKVLEFKDETLEELVTRHAEMKKSLGENHILVRQMWAEIRQRNK